MVILMSTAMVRQWDSVDLTIIKLTAFMGFDHQLIDRCQLSIVELAHFLGFDVWHIYGARVLEVFESLRNEQA